MKRKYWIYGGLVLGLMFLLYRANLQPPIKIMPTEADSLLYRFVVSHMLDASGGVYTNLRDDHPMIPDVAKNHSYLSESTGLLLLYAVKEQKRDLFDQQVQFLNQHLLMKEGLSRWMVDPPRKIKADSNASIDDLRIIRGLLLGYRLWGEPSHLDQALAIAKGVKKWNLREDFCLVDFYHTVHNERTSKITISYLDLHTMKLLTAYDPDWEKIYKKSLALIREAELPNGLYRKTYDYDQGSWLAQEEVNLIDSFYTSLHLIEAGLEINRTLAFIKQQWDRHQRLYGIYSLEGKPLADFESPAVYGLAIRMFMMTDEKQLVKELFERLRHLQVQDPRSPYYGGFVDLDKTDAYSFDQLQVLLVESEDNPDGQ